MADTFRIKRRLAGGAAGPPGSLAAAELAFNEQDNTLYYGKGNSGGLATSIVSIAGVGAFAPRTTMADTPPLLPLVGDQWWDSVEGQLYLRFNDGTSSQWVPAVNQPGPAGPIGPIGPPGGSPWQVGTGLTLNTVTDPDTILLTVPVAVSSGGTGATGAAAARANLDAEPTITSGTPTQYWRGDKSWQLLDKVAVGLANVDNTSDLNKPISIATQTALDFKAPLASPLFTGDPRAPTPVTSDNDTSIATTAFVKAQGYQTGISLTSFSLRDTSAAFDVTLAATSVPALTAGRSLTFDMGDVAHTLDFGTIANTISFPSAAAPSLAALNVAGTWSATQTSMPLSGATLSGITSIPGGQITAAGELGLGAIPPSTKLHLGGTYTTAFANYLYLSGTFASSGTVIQALLDILTTFAPSGASVNNLIGMRNSPTLNSTALTIPAFYGFYGGATFGAAFTGVITNYYGFSSANPTVTGGTLNAVTHFFGTALTNGNNLAAGTVTNQSFYSAPHSASSAGGTVSNRGGVFYVPTGGSSAGVTHNRAIYISGAGGVSTGGAVNNFALFSDSTAPMQIAGLFQFNGATASFPALKRSTTTIQARLADDSAYATLDALSVLDSGVAPTGTAGSGYVRATLPTLTSATLTGTTSIPNGQITSVGNFLIGNATPVTVGSIGSPNIQITNTAGAHDIVTAQFSNDTIGSTSAVAKSRGSVTTAGALVTNDGISRVRYVGDDGSTNGAINIVGADLLVAVDGAVATGIVPMRFNWSTMDVTGSYAARMRLHASGGWSLGNTIDPGAGNASIIGMLLVGSDTSYNGQGGFARSVQLYVNSGIQIGRHAADTFPPGFSFSKSRHATVGSHTAVVADDFTMQITGTGSDGTAYQANAYIAANVDGAVSAGIVPGRLSFATTNSSGASSERLRITSNGLVTFGGGATASFPGLRRSTTELQHRLADDTAFGPVAASAFSQAANENGARIDFASRTELTTIAAAASTTTAMFIPTNSVVLAVSVRVVTAIPTATSFSVGVTGTVGRYGAGILVAAGTTSPGTLAGPLYYASAIGVLITPNLTPAAATGQVRVTIHYYLVTPPTS